MSELAFDLFCGKGGWAPGFIDAGYRVVGFDIEDFSTVYPGEFFRADLRQVHGADLVELFGRPRVAVASVPCQGFSLAAARWHRPPTGFDLWATALRLRAELGCPVIIENVRGAIRFYGKPKLSRFPWYLWGDVPDSLLVPDRLPKKWNAGRYGGKKPEDSAMVPYVLARAVADAFLPEGDRQEGSG